MAKKISNSESFNIFADDQELAEIADQIRALNKRRDRINKKLRSLRSARAQIDQRRTLMDTTV